MDMETLLRFNPWWESGEISEELAKPFKRKLFYEVLKVLGKRQIVEIVGLRRVGKTTLLYQLIQTLLKKVNERKVLYFSFDEEIGSVKELIRVYEREVIHKKIEDAGKVYIFLVEIQKCKNWDSQLKIFYDLYPNIKFFISGSASLLLDKKAKESLAGRVIGFTLKPLSFGEFLEFKGTRIKKLKLGERTLATQFFDYLKKGGFIELTFEESDKRIREYVRANVLERIIFRDVPEAFGARDLELMKTLVELFCKESGMILNVDSLARDLGRSKLTISNYIYYLRFSMLIRLVKNLRKGFLIASRKRKKVYVNSTAFIYAYRDVREAIERFLETYVCAALDLEYYYRDRFEIDFIKKNKRIVGIEVKSKVRKSEVEAFSKKLSRLGIKKGIVVTKDQKFRVKGVEVKPAYFIL